MDTEELNVDESCIDTSLPTDVSLSQDDASEMEDILKSNENFPGNRLKSIHTNSAHRFSKNYESGDDGRIFKEQKLKNEFLKMNVQLKEKSIKLDALKAENFQNIENLESKLNQALRENGLLKIQMKMENEEMGRIKEDLIQKLNNIESNQGYLKMASADIQKVLEAPCITEDHYNSLLSTSSDSLSIIDFIAKHLYERQLQHQKMMEATRMGLKEKQDQVHNLQLLTDQLNDDLDKERQGRVETQARLQRSVAALEALKCKLVDDDFKSNNFDAVSKEKDDLEMRVADLSKQTDLLQRQLNTANQQIAECQSELTSLKQCNGLLSKDKAYLSQLSEELLGKVTFLEGRCHHLDLQNEKFKVAREELYEKYISTRDQYKRDYDERLREGLERMGKQMEEDIERLKQANRDVSEREIRTLREARDMAFAEKKSALASEKELSQKYELLLLDFRQKQLWSGGKTSDLQNELKVKSFEYQKLQLLLEETTNNLKESQASYDRLHKKMDVLLKEYYSMQMTLEKRNTHLEATLKLKDSEATNNSSQEVVELKRQLFVMKNKVTDLETERSSLLLEKKQMAGDLQKLLKHDEEMKELKMMVLKAKNKTSPQKTHKQAPKITFRPPRS